MAKKLQEYSSYNTLGNNLMNKLRYRNGGKFPVTASRADIAWALGECNKDTSDYMIRLGAKALERVGVRVQGVTESRAADADFLISSVERGVSIPAALAHLREKGNGDSKSSAEKMAQAAGKKPGDDGYDELVKKFEKHAGKLNGDDKKKEESVAGGSRRPFTEQATDPIIRALADVLEWAKGNRGSKSGNPYGIPEIKAALQVLAKVQGNSSYLDVDTALLAESIVKGLLAEGYQGWFNYPTWSVALIFDNDRGLYEFIRSNMEDGTWAGPASLEDDLKEFIEDSFENGRLTELRDQLIAGALSDINWRELWEHWSEE